jgi:hypothetical protein
VPIILNMSQINVRGLLRKPLSDSAISAFRHHLIERRHNALMRRGQRHRLTLTRMKTIADRYLRARRRGRIRVAAAAGNRDRRRSAGIASADPVHDPCHLSLPGSPRPLAEPPRYPTRLPTAAAAGGEIAPGLRRYWSYLSNSVSVKVVADKAPDHRRGLLDAQTTFSNGVLGPVEFHQPMWRRRGSNMRRLARRRVRVRWSDMGIPTR